MRFILIGLILTLSVPAAGRVIRITRDEVRCVTVTHADGAVQTRCTLHRGHRLIPPPLQLGVPNNSPAPRALSQLVIPPPLGSDEIPDVVPQEELTPQELTPKELTPRTRPPADNPDLPQALDPDDIPSAHPFTQRRAQEPSVDPPARSVPDMTAQEAQVLALLNVERTRRNMNPLRPDPTATATARAHSRDMCQRQFFDHVSPDGANPWDRLRRGGAQFTAAAENIAVGYRSAEEVHRGWLDSPGHRANRLNPIYQRAGVGIYTCGGTIYWTELFMK